MSNNESLRPKPDEKDVENVPEESAPGDESCRCKETRDKTFLQVFKLMLKDITPWRKNK